MRPLHCDPRRRLAPVSVGVNGTWFVGVVAAQSVGVVASGPATAMSGSNAPSGVEAGLTIIAVVMWAVGIELCAACAVYLPVRTIVHRLGPKGLDAPFSVTMGAPAISVLAGSRIMAIESAPIPAASRLLIGGTCVTGSRSATRPARGARSSPWG